MGKLKTFEIVVHNANGTVKAGDRLLGQLVVQIIDDLTVKGKSTFSVLVKL